jgi:ketosteroid isomerase-like protein
MTQQDEQTAERIRQTVLKRMKALAAPDLNAAGEIIADDFQLIPPNGAPLTKAQYFASIESGAIRYRVWEAASHIAVRLYGDVAAIRYQAEIIVEATTATRKGRYWFSDLYEKRDGRWQIVWSQGTFVAA